MSFFLTSAALSCKRTLRRRGAWPVFLLLPLLCAGLCAFWALEQPMIRVRVGVGYDPQNEFHQTLFDTLCEKDVPVEFMAFSLEEQEAIEQAVATGRLECAYLFHDHLGAESVAQADRDAITLLKSPQSVLDLYFTEVIFSALYEHSAWAMDMRLLTGQLGLDDERAAALLEERFAYYAQDESLSLQPVFEMQTPTGDGIAESSGLSASGARIVHGAVAVFLLLMTAGALPALIGEKRDMLGRLDLTGARTYLFGTAAGLFALGAALGLGTLCLSGLIYPPVLGPALNELFSLAAYQLALSAIAVLLVVLLRGSDVVYGGAVFLVLLTLVLGGVFLDIGELSPLLGALSNLFLSTHYLNAALQTAAAAVWVLLGLSAAAGASIAALLRVQRRNIR